MEGRLCVAERYCGCGSSMHVEFEGAPGCADNAVVDMFDELHHGPECGPVSPQQAAIARSCMSRRELRARKTVATAPPVGDGRSQPPDEETPLFCAIRAELRSLGELPQ